MNANCRAGVFLLCLSWASLPVFAQLQTGPMPAGGQLQSPPISHARDRIVLDVVVTDKAGKPVKGLEEKDFSVLDDGHPQSLQSFQAVDGVVAADIKPAEPPVKVIMLIDEVNTNFSRVAYERDEIKKFLLQNNGVLPYPTSFVFFSDTGVQIQEGSSRDGNALLASFEQHETALRSIRRGEGFYGAVERFQLSLNTLNSLVAKEGPTPGRKIVIWISPGWPILSGPGIELTAKNQAGLFASVVAASTALRLARITLYSVDPQGAEAAGGLREFYYQDFLKPAAAAKNTQAGNLALQVLAVQSGGLALPASNDITAQLMHCVTDVDAVYTLTIDPAHADRPNEFHAIQVKVATPGLTARTRNGYYAQP
jgi:VWFA-related protein